MINIKEIDGQRLKKDLGIERASKQWHNRNKSGGNFGTNLFLHRVSPSQPRGYMITGRYNTEGYIYSLTFNTFFGNEPTPIPNHLTYPEMIRTLKILIAEYEQRGR